MGLRSCPSVHQSPSATVSRLRWSSLRPLASAIPQPWARRISFDVSTSQDVGTRTASYTTTISQISQPQVTLTTNGVGKPSGYTVAFQTGAGGLLSRRNRSYLYRLPQRNERPSIHCAPECSRERRSSSGVSTSPGNRRVEITTAALWQHHRRSPSSSTWQPMS